MQHLPFPKMIYLRGIPSGKPGDFREVANADQLEAARRDGFEEYDPLEKSRSPEERDRIRVDEERRERERLSAEGAAEIERLARERSVDETTRQAELGRGPAAEESSADTKKLDEKSKATASQVDAAGNVLPGKTGLEPGGGHSDAAKPEDAPNSATVEQQSGNQSEPVKRKVNGGQNKAEQGKDADKAKG